MNKWNWNKTAAEQELDGHWNSFKIDITEMEMLIETNYNLSRTEKKQEWTAT